MPHGKDFLNKGGLFAQFMEKEEQHKEKVYNPSIDNRKIIEK